MRQLLRVGWTTWKLGASLLALAVSAKGRARPNGHPASGPWSALRLGPAPAAAESSAEDSD